MAHALHQNILQKCGTMDFKQCDALLPAPFGADLLRSIRDVSFVGMQGTQVMSNGNHCRSRTHYSILMPPFLLFSIALSLSLFLFGYSSFRFDSIRMVMHMDIIIFTNINDMGKNLITFRLALGKKRNYLINCTAYHVQN